MKRFFAQRAHREQISRCRRSFSRNLNLCHRLEENGSGAHELCRFHHSPPAARASAPMTSDAPQPVLTDSALFVSCSQITHRPPRSSSSRPPRSDAGIASWTALCGTRPGSPPRPRAREPNSASRPAPEASSDLRSRHSHRRATLADVERLDPSCRRLMTWPTATGSQAGGAQPCGPPSRDRAKQTGSLTANALGRTAGAREALPPPWVDTAAARGPRCAR